MDTLYSSCACTYVGAHARLALFTEHIKLYYVHVYMCVMCEWSFAHSDDGVTRK